MCALAERGGACEMVTGVGVWREQLYEVDEKMTSARCVS